MLRMIRLMVQQLEYRLGDDPVLWWTLVTADALAFALWWALRAWAGLLH